MEHKKEIIESRVGALGGSDATLLQQVDKLGYVPHSAYKRLAICRGIILPDSTKTSRAMEFGNFVEDNIYVMLSENKSGFESNPRWVSKKYSKRNVQLICHPDIVWFDNENKTLWVYEVKATKLGLKTTKETYRGQLFVEWELAKEIAKELGDWKVKLALVHYDTEGVDLDEEFEIHTDRISITNVSFKGGARSFIDLDKAMNIVDEFLSTFNTYYTEDEIDSRYLPEDVKHEFDTITQLLSEIKEREKRVEDFKSKLYSFMLEKEIKSIKNEFWTITRVDGSEMKTFDGKRFIEDYISKHPNKGRKLAAEYSKTIQRKGAVQIRLKTKTK